MRLDHLLSKEQTEAETQRFILWSIVKETDAEAKAEANEGTHVEAVKGSKSMERAKAGHMQVKHLKGWVDKRRTASQRKSVEGVDCSVSFSGFIEGWNLRRRNPPKLHLDNCTSNDPKTGQLRNGVLGAGENGVARESERKGNGRRNILGK